jgi:hypothetical protein
MRKTIYVSTAILFCLLGGLQVAGISNANPYPPAASSMVVISPQSAINFIYQNTSISLIVELDLLVDDTTGASPQITHVTYSLDGKENVTTSTIPKSGREYSQPLDLFGRAFAHYVAITVNAGTLDNLSDGKHTVYIYAFDTKGGVMWTGCPFEVLTTYKIPTVEIISPKNQVTVNEVPLTCIINGSYTQLCYAIDYLRTGYNISIQGNTTITIWGLRNGEHELRVYATNPGRYGGSDVIFFTKNCSADDPTTNPTSPPSPTLTNSPTPRPTPTITSMPPTNEQTPTSEPAQAASDVITSNKAIAVIACVITLLAVSSSLVYLKKRKKLTK